MYAILQLFKKVGTRWEPDGPGMRYQEDTMKTAREKAASYGERYVAKDPGNRQYNIFDG